MHYYKFNISDWALSTNHLSEIEELVYFRLMNFYYDTEQPIPKETHSVIRRLRLGNHSDTVALILSEFFHETEKGWEHSRINEVIETYHETAEKNKSNGKKGGRPRANKGQKPSGLPVGSQTEPKHNLNQELLTINQEPLTNIKDTSGKPNVCPHQEIINIYHETLPQLPRIKVWNDKRQTALRTRWNEDKDRQDLDYWKNLFTYIGQSDFLTGKSNSFRADLEWIVNSTNFVKIIEGRYENK